MNFLFLLYSQRVQKSSSTSSSTSVESFENLSHVTFHGEELFFVSEPPFGMICSL